MIEEPKNALEEIYSDQSFIMILAGAIIWLLGYYVGPLGGLFLATGFVLVCFYAIVASLRRPAAQAWPWLLLGGLMQIIGYYTTHLVPILPYALIVSGGIMIIYFAIPLALQRGELPVITRLQKFIESQMHDKKKEDTEGQEDKEVEEPEEKEPESAEDE